MVAHSSGRRPDARTAIGQGIAALGYGDEPSCRCRYKSIGYSHQIHPGWGAEQKGASTMAKLHARPSNQYRYEHYDPRF